MGEGGETGRSSAKLAREPMGIAEYKLLESLPAELQISLPSIEQIKRELTGIDTSTQNDST